MRSAPAAFGWIPSPPPHCPFDSVVLRELTLPKMHDIPWTKMDDIDVYRAWVEAAKKKAKACKSLPDWEVQVWNKQAPYRKLATAEASTGVRVLEIGP